MRERIREKLFRLLGGGLLLFLLSLLFYYEPLSIKEGFNFLHNFAYDTTVRLFAKPLKKETPIAIIDIDDKSLSEVGRWPWPRDILAELVDKLFAGGAIVVALDTLFSEPEQNIIDEVVATLQQEKKEESSLAELKNERELFNNDEKLAVALHKGSSVLPCIFTNFGDSLGVLPHPLLQVDPKEKELLPFLFYKEYLSNIASLETAAASAGFINAHPDDDGIVRSADLLLGYGDHLYGSLSLAATLLYLLEDKISLNIQKYPHATIVEAINVGKESLPTDASGRILIPFRGPAYTFPYISAVDLLQGKVDPEKIRNKLLFVGSSASGWKDVFPTAIAPTFPGAEIHATVAAGILDHYLPQEPTWGKGLLLLLMILLGLLVVLTFPFLGAILSTFILLAMIFLLISFQVYLWTHHALFISMVIPIVTLFLLYLFQEIVGYFTETRRKKELKAVFGQYVPVEHIDRMLHAKNVLDLAGENKELTVLFSDIRNFTHIAEKLSAPEIKQVLNEYLTPMTEVIFEHHGTIDKYVGDMIMAFWGAPLPDVEHPLHALKATLAMQKKLEELNKSFFAPKGLEIHIGIGLNTGMMNVGDMGSKFRRAYTVLGDAVNTASRMESITKFYQVPNIVSETTRLKGKEQFLFRTLDKVLLKGKENATYLFEVVDFNTNKELLSQHEEGLKLYWQQKWDEAEKLFRELRQKVVTRAYLYDLYLSRIEAFKKAPPGEGWNGVYVLENK